MPDFSDPANDWSFPSFPSSPVPTTPGSGGGSNPGAFTNWWNTYGGFVEAGLNTAGQLYANRGNRRESERQRNWEEMMSNTAVQRHVVDLEKAGLNKMLAYGGSASTPSYQRAEIGNPFARGGQDVQGHTAVQAESKYKERSGRLADAQAALADITAGKTEAEKDLIVANIGKTMAEIDKIGAETDVQKQEFRLKMLLGNIAALDESQKRLIFPALLKAARSDAIRKAAGMDTVDRISSQESTFWKALGTLGEHIADGVYDGVQGIKRLWEESVSYKR